MGKKKVAEQSGKEPVHGVVPSGTAPQKRSKRIQFGRIYIKASYNNTIVSVTDDAGNLVTWASSGSLGFSGPKKATPFASSKIIATVAERIKSTGPSDVEVVISGVGSGRDSAVRSIINHGFNVLAIKDVTPIPHNGPRPPKVRRV